MAQSITSRVFEKLQADEILSRSASVAFYSALAVAPLLLLLVTFLSYLEINVQSQLINEVTNLMGAEAATVLQAVIESAQDRPDLASSSGWIGALLLFISASIVFAELQNTLNIIFGANSQQAEVEGIYANAKQYAMRRLVSFGMLLAFILITIASLIASAALSYFLTDSMDEVARWINIFANLVVFTLLFSLIYKILPDREVHFSNCLLGGLITAVMFIIGKSVIGSYIGKTAVGSAYGAAGSLMVFLVWVYYSALIVFAGAELSAAFLLKEKRKVLLGANV